MPKIQKVIAGEIERLARRECNKLVKPIMSNVAELKKLLHEQSRKLKALEAARAAKTESLPSDEKVQTDENSGIVRLGGKRIAAIRKKFGLTQKQFATLLGVNVFSVTRWESGKGSPREDMRHKIAGLRKTGRRELSDTLAGKGVHIPKRRAGNAKKQKQASGNGSMKKSEAKKTNAASATQK